MKARVLKVAPGMWGSNVWFGGWYAPATSKRRYYYRTRREARGADISDSRNVLAVGCYLASGPDQGPMDSFSA